MVVEHLTDEHRLLLITLTTEAWVRIRDDPAMEHATQECHDIISMLSGTDTRVRVERAYGSHVNRHRETA